MAKVNPAASWATHIKAKRGAARRKARQREIGHWMPWGVRVEMTQAKGLTKPGLLTIPFRFQCPPTDDLTVSLSTGWTDYETIGRDTLSRPAALGLKSIGFNTLFVDYEASFAVHRRGVDKSAKPLDPPLIRRELEKIMETQTPFTLHVGNPHLWGKWDISGLYTMRQLDSTERAGEPDTRYFSISFVEYRRPQLHRKAKTYHPKLPITVIVARDGTAHDTAGHKFGSAAHPVTLHMIAKEYYGAAAKWRHLITRNKAWKNWPASRPMMQAPKTRKMKLQVPKISHAAKNAHHDGGKKSARRTARRTGGTLAP